MTIPEIRLECIKISASVEEYYQCSVVERAEQYFEWIFKNHPHSENDSQVISKLNSLIRKIDKMGENTEKALADLQEINTKLTKISAESTTLLQKITDLENAAANADTPQSVLDAIAVVKAQATTVDDLVPDATEPPVE